MILMYTGGTTGLPKGVLLDQRAEMLNLYHAAMAVGLDEDRVYLHQTPMFHAASMTGVLGIPASGGVSVFVPYFEPGAGARRDRALPGQHDADGADRWSECCSRAPEFGPERLASLDDAGVRRVADAAGPARAAASTRSRASTCTRATG